MLSLTVLALGGMYWLSLGQAKMVHKMGQKNCPQVDGMPKSERRVEKEQMSEFSHFPPGDIMQNKKACHPSTLARKASAK
jgi:hypothetical protein